MTRQKARTKRTVPRLRRGRSRPAGAGTTSPPEWLPLGRIARVEVSSEDRSYPLADALSATGNGWRASAPGPQVIRMIFPEPRAIGRIRLAFSEQAVERTQEFVLTCSTHRGERHCEIVRQQFNFSPRGATRQIEEYHVELQDLAWLELRVVPDIARPEAIASLEEFRLA